MLLPFLSTLYIPFSEANVLYSAPMRRLLISLAVGEAIATAKCLANSGHEVLGCGDGVSGLR